jgi:NADH dehydrogenase [ubiquinone] 1 alpha subcomplex assembly factor 5
MPAHKRQVSELFDVRQRALHRDRAARIGPELFLHERAFDDCLERIALQQRRFEHALLIGCPDPVWRERLGSLAARVDVRDPGVLFAARAHGEIMVEDAWEPPELAHDLVLAIGTLDTVNQLPLALRLIRYAMRSEGLLIGALSGGDTLPQLRRAIRAADALIGIAAPHVHPRIEPAALAPLLSDAGFIDPVVDVDRVSASYASLDRLVADLRAMGATNILTARPSFIGKAARHAAIEAFAAAGDGERTVETFEILHFAAWNPEER